MIFTAFDQLLSLKVSSFSSVLIKNKYILNSFFYRTVIHKLQLKGKQEVLSGYT